MVADRLLCRIAEKLLGRAIPASDFAFEICSDNTIVGRFHNGCQEGASSLGLPTLGAILSNPDQPLDPAGRVRGGKCSQPDPTNLPAGSDNTIFRLNTTVCVSALKFANGVMTILWMD